MHQEVPNTLNNALGVLSEAIVQLSDLRENLRQVVLTLYQHDGEEDDECEESIAPSPLRITCLACDGELKRLPRVGDVVPIACLKCGASYEPSASVFLDADDPPQDPT